MKGKFDVYSLAREREKLKQRQIDVYKNVVEVIKRLIERVNKYQSFLVYEVPCSTESPSYVPFECLRYCQQVFVKLGMQTRILMEYRTLVVSWNIEPPSSTSSKFVGLALRSEMLRNKSSS